MSWTNEKEWISSFLYCVLMVFLYACLLMLSEWNPTVLQLSVLMIAGGILGIVAWIGYVMATTKSSPVFITSED